MKRERERERERERMDKVPPRASEGLVGSAERSSVTRSLAKR